MFNRIIMGKPHRCPIEICKEKWFKDSIQGYMPHTEQTVLVVMKCPKCKYQFAIVQAVSMVKEYINELPVRPKRNLSNINQINESEIKQVQKMMDNSNILSSLNESFSDKPDLS